MDKMISKINRQYNLNIFLCLVFGLIICLLTNTSLKAQNRELKTREERVKELANEYYEKVKPQSSLTSKQPGGTTTGKLLLTVEFKKGSSELTPEWTIHLDALGRALTREDTRDYLYRIEAHTCDLGPKNKNIDPNKFNDELSTKRGERVRDYLVEKFNLSREQFVIKGWGMRDPLFPNINEENRKKNRRVIIIRTSKKFFKNGRAEKDQKPHLNIEAIYTRAGEILDIEEGCTLTSKDNYAIQFISTRDAYVYCYQIDSQGEAFCLFPNTEYSKDENPIEASRAYRIPSEYGRWIYLDEEDRGRETLTIIASKDKIDSPEIVCKNLTQNKSPSDMAKVNPDDLNRKSPGGTRLFYPEKKNNQRPVQIEDTKVFFSWKISFEHQ